MRIVNLEQDDKISVTITISFVNNVRWSGRAMTHAVPVRIKRHLDRSGWKITLDEFETMRTSQGPSVKFERLPHVHESQSSSEERDSGECLPSSDPKNPATTIAPIIAHSDPPISAQKGAPAHVLAVIHVSNYHVMDCPLGIHGVPHALWPISDHTRTAPESTMKVMISLNHTIHFHNHDGFRADEPMYIEVISPWAKDERAMIHSRIFSKQGFLIATVVQEMYLV